MYKFFKEDLDALDNKIKELGQLVKETGKQIGAACEDGEREHDNPEFDDATRRMEMWSKHLRDTHETRSKAILIEPNEVHLDVVDMGCTVTFVDQDDNKRIVSIGSYIPSDASTDISYQAPIAKILIGLAVGEHREGKIAGREVEFEVLKIEKTHRSV